LLVAGTVIAGLIGVVSFCSNQPAWFVWPVRLFCVIWLVGLWYHALRELRGRRRNGRPLNSCERLADPGAPPNGGPATPLDNSVAGKRPPWVCQMLRHSRVMQSPGAILYDSGRFPLWFRIPALLFGLFALWLAMAIAAYGLSGVSLGFSLADVHGSLLLGSLGCFAIAAMWIFVWFAHLRLSFDATRQELIVSKRGYLRWHEHHVALAGAREFHIRHVPAGFTHPTWKVHIIFTDGRTERLIDIDFRSEAESLAESLRSATNLPVTIQDDAS